MGRFQTRFDEFHSMAQQAMAQSGLDLSDFGDIDYHQPLRNLLASYDNNSQLSEVGEQIAIQGIVGNLTARLLEEQGFNNHPEFSNSPIKQPLIIIGMTRTGTTVLHRLMASDPAMQSLPLWLGSMPMLRPERETWQDNPFYQQVDQAYEGLYALNPVFKSLHPMIASEPDECRIAMEHSFWSPAVPCTATLTEYARWCLNADARYAYRRYKKVLGLVAAGNTERWVLKDPCHLWGLPSLLEIFPDALFIFTHRDPLDAMSSSASTTYQIRKLSEPNIDPKAIGQEVMTNWASALNRVETERKAIPAHRIVDVHISELKSKPLQTLKRLYQHLNIPISDEACHVWAGQVSSDPNGGHGQHQYAAQQFGLSHHDVINSLVDYQPRYQCVVDAL